MLIIQLNPFELGHLRIEIGHAHSVGTEVRLTAEKPTTLALLQHDQVQLNAALDQAGVSSERRILHFDLATSIHADSSKADNHHAASDGRNHDDHSHMPAQASQGSTGETSIMEHSEPTPDPIANFERIGVDITA
jgi:hypothetical protein